MTQELLDQLPLSFAPEPVPVEEPANYSENGIIFANLIDALNEYRTSKESFCEFLKQAIQHKIWLGFLNPVNGKFVSFIHKLESGEIQESVSFKLWIASSPKKGGLGFSSLEDLEQLIKGDRLTSELALPLMLDNHSIAQVNQVREAQGEPPLIKISSSKQHYLRKCSEAPKEFSMLRYDKGLPLELVARCVGNYEKLSEESQEVVINELRGLIDRCSDKSDLEEKASELFNVPCRRMMCITVGDAGQIARALYKTVKEDGALIKEVIEKLFDIINDGEEAVEV